MVDMRRHLPRYLNDATLARMGGRYEGIIANVVEGMVRNPYTAQRELQPIILFDDGWRCIPNVGMRAALIELFGPDTETWVGRRITIVRQRRETTNRTTGEVRERWVKIVYCEDKHARILPHPAAVDDAPDWVTERSDYDDSPEAIAEASARRRRA